MRDGGHIHETPRAPDGAGQPGGVAPDARRALMQTQRDPSRARGPRRTLPAVAGFTIAAVAAPTLPLGKSSAPAHAPLLAQQLGPAVFGRSGRFSEEGV